MTGAQTDPVSTSEWIIISSVIASLASRAFSCWRTTNRDRVFECWWNLRKFSDRIWFARGIDPETQDLKAATSELQFLAELPELGLNEQERISLKFVADLLGVLQKVHEEACA